MPNAGLQIKKALCCPRSTEAGNGQKIIEL